MQSHWCFYACAACRCTSLPVQTNVGRVLGYFCVPQAHRFRPAGWSAKHHVITDPEASSWLGMTALDARSLEPTREAATASKQLISHAQFRTRLSRRLARYSRGPERNEAIRRCMTSLRALRPQPPVTACDGGSSLVGSHTRPINSRLFWAVLAALAGSCL